MRKWTPRRPSPDLRARLFGAPPLSQSAVRTLGEFSRWVVPAFGCFLLVIGGLSQRLPDARMFGLERGRADAEAGSKSRFMFAEARQHSEINAIPVKHLQYSLGSNLAQPAQPASGFTSTNHSIPQ